MTKVLKDNWKPQDQTAEMIYEDQSLSAAKGQKVTHERAPQVQQGPIVQPDF